MANEDYELYCQATIPGLSVLDRQILGHYCQRFNETVTPPRAWPGLAELRRITGAHEKSISRSIGRLIRRGFLSRVTLASNTKGKQAQYAINKTLLRSLVQVTVQLPENKEVTHLQVTDETPSGNLEVPIGNRAVTEVEPYGYPKRIERNEPINVTKDHVSKDRSKDKGAIDQQRWLRIMDYIDSSSRPYINPAPNTERLLDLCKSEGMSVSAIGTTLGRVNYSTAVSVGGLFTSTLEDLASVKAVSKSSSMPPHCGHDFCDPGTRTFPEPSMIEGKMTYNCPKCHPLMKREVKAISNTTTNYDNVFRSVD